MTPLPFLWDPDVHRKTPPTIPQTAPSGGIGIGHRFRQSNPTPLNSLKTLRWESWRFWNNTLIRKGSGCRKYLCDVCSKNLTSTIYWPEVIIPSLWTSQCEVWSAIFSARLSPPITVNNIKCGKHCKLCACKCIVYQFTLYMYNRSAFTCISVQPIQLVRQTTNTPLHRM